MVWVSGAKLAAAAAESGVLGMIGAGSMQPELLQSQIEKAQALTRGSLAVNVPLLYPKAKEQIEVAYKKGIRIFFTSAGSPKTFTRDLKERGCVVTHVTSTPKLAKKCADAGVDAVVAEGFEAGGHNGRDEITTLNLIPQVVDQLSIPVIAAGGIGDGRQMAAAFCLGADGVQVGSRYAATIESSAHDNFKQAIVAAGPTATMLSMKKLVPVRLLKNEFYKEVSAAEDRCASADELKTILGTGRAKKGMHLGELEGGELEIGQVSALIKDIVSCREITERLLSQYRTIIQNLPNI